MIFNFERILSFYLYGIVLFRPDLKYTIRILPRSCKTFKSTVALLFFKGQADIRKSRPLLIASRN